MAVPCRNMAWETNITSGLLLFFLCIRMEVFLYIQIWVCMDVRLRWYVLDIYTKSVRWRRVLHVYTHLCRQLCVKHLPYSSHVCVCIYTSGLP